MPKYNRFKHKNPSNDIKVFSLGGIGVVGMNMYVVECNDEIIVMDSGILFADDEALGVDYVIPDFTYLKENQEKIVGLFITHGHEDHIGALPFLLAEVQIPAIYASGIAVGLIRNKMSEYPDIIYNLQSYNPDSEYTYKNFKISFFRTNHSIPDSFGIAIKTRLGYIVNTGDFKFDFNPLGPKSEYHKMTKLGAEGVLCLLSESTNADIAQFSPGERKIAKTLKQLFKRTEGRIIVATFASNVYRVQQIIEASVESGRQVIVFGYSMEKTIEAAIKLKYIDVPKGTILYSRELKKQTTDHVTILCTGSQGEPMAALSRIANGTHKQIKLLPNDTVIYSSKPIPGNEQFINRNINKLIHAGANVIKNSILTDTHTTGHASQNELRLMLSFMQPKYFMPIHGEPSMLKDHKDIAVELGMNPDNCFILEAGDVLSFNSKGAKVTKKAVPANDVYLDSELNQVEDKILKERQILSDDGIISVSFLVNKSKKIVTNSTLETKGFIDVNNSKDLQKSIEQKSVELLNNILQSAKNLNASYLKKQLTSQLNLYIYQKIGRKPLIVSIIKIK